ncbi:MAG: small basic protein [Planctomycetes bacterium]|nr:small basic protein [Planctomycetota bacterium]
MSVDKSLKPKGKLARPRNVYRKIERIAILKAEGRWTPESSAFGIPKVRVEKLKRKGKAAKKAEAPAAAAAATEGKAEKEKK